MLHACMHYIYFDDDGADASAGGPSVVGYSYFFGSPRTFGPLLLLLFPIRLFFGLPSGGPGGGPPKYDLFVLRPASDCGASNIGVVVRALPLIPASSASRVDASGPSASTDL